MIGWKQVSGGQSWEEILWVFKKIVKKNKYFILVVLRDLWDPFRGPQGQNYFDNDSKMVHVFFTYIYSLSSIQWVFQKLHDVYLEDWMQKQIWEFVCLLLSRIFKRFPEQCKTMLLFQFFFVFKVYFCKRNVICVNRW